MGTDQTQQPEAFGTAPPSSAVLLSKALQECERYESTLPHLLVCIDRCTGEESFSGPFPTRAEAEAVLEHERNALGNSPDLEFRTAALFPGLELTRGWLGSGWGNQPVGGEVR